jgi:hypothetical protein
MFSMKKSILFCAAVMIWVVVFAVVAGAEEVKFKRYTDKKFGFSVEYPDIYNDSNGQYIGRDGLSNFGAYSSTENGDGKYAFMISGGEKTKGADGNSLLKEATNMKEDEYGYVYGVEPIEGTAHAGADFYTFDYTDDSAGLEEIVHEHCVVGKDHFAKYWIRYPKEEAEIYAEITARMDESLKLK